MKGGGEGYNGNCFLLFVDGMPPYRGKPDGGSVRKIVWTRWRDGRSIRSVPNTFVVREVLV